MVKVIAFLIWCICGGIFAVYGIYILFSKKEKAFGFWANAELCPIENVAGYNRALGKLFFVAGIVFIMIGLPLLKGENSPFVLFSVLGTMLEVIIVMMIYTLGIEKKYRKRGNLHE